MPIPIENRHTACLLGGAIGDALGAPVEFLSLGDIRKEYGPGGISDYVEFPGHTGEFTDDTQMTLFTAEGILRAWHRISAVGMSGTPNLLVFHSYVRWLHTQIKPTDHYPGIFFQQNLNNGWLISHPELFKRRSPGNACLSSLRTGVAGTIKKPVNLSKGCGGIMRMAPVGLVFDNPASAFKTGCELAAITHGHPSGYISAGAFAAIIQQLADGNDLESSIQTSINLLHGISGHEETLDAVNYAIDWYHKTKIAVQDGSINLADQVGRLGEGWVAEESLAISLFCSLHHQHDFRSGVLAAVNHRGDSDSTGSITGNILGLINGIGSIPEKWIHNLRSAEIVRQIGDDLYAACHVSANGNPEWWERFPGY